MTARSRTLHLTNAWHETSGGVKTVYQALMRAAAGRRRMAVVVPGARDHDEQVAEGVTVYHVKAPRSPWIDRRYRIVLPHRYLLPSARLARIIQQEVPDLIEITDKLSLCYLAGWLRKWPGYRPRPVLVGFSAERFDTLTATHLAHVPGIDRFARWFMRRIYSPMFDYHLANSPYTADEVAASLEPHRARRLAWLALGVDTVTFHPGARDEALRADLLARAGGSPTATLVVTASRLSREKHVDLLVDAAATLVGRHGMDARFVIAGDGPERHALESAFSARVTGRACFLGHVDDRRMLAGVKASADAFAHTNATEPFGIGPLEAMAAGAAVVVPASGGVLAYATDRNAWLYPPGPSAFATAIRSASTHGPDRDARLAAARVTTTARAWPAVAEQMFGAYDALVAARADLTRHVSPRSPRPERFHVAGVTPV